MILSKRSNGIYYIFYLQPNGKRTCVSTRTTKKSEALKFLLTFERRLEEKKAQKVIPITLKEYCEHFLNYSKHVHANSTYRGYDESLKCLKKYFGDVAITELTQRKISEYFTYRMNTGSLHQARKDLICFSSCFNKAIIDGYLETNPCKGIKRFRIPQKLPVFFSESEFDLLVASIKEKDVMDIVIFALHTGLRQMELLTLEWNQVNLRDRLVILTNQNHTTKSKKIRTVPLTNKAMEILTNRELNMKGNLVFTNCQKPMKHSFICHKFKKYVREIGINPKLNFHSLRHTFASWLVQRGVSIYEVSKLLGHSSVTVTEIYSHLRTENLRTAVNVLNK